MAETKEETARAANLREVVGDLLYMAERYVKKTPATESVIFDAKTKKEIQTINYYDVIAKAEAALAAPPRNCERFQTVTQAKNAYCAEVRRVFVWDGCETERLVDWLLAPATEKEGGAK